MGKYGCFTEDGKEFVITRPDTPQPWLNYSLNGRYHALISHTGGGYSYYVSPLNSRITRRRYNSLPEDRPGRYLYIRDNDTGEYYSPTWQPTQTPLEAFECRHGCGYTRITTRYRGLTHSILYFVPIDADIEIWRITIRNDGAERRLSLFPYVEFVPGDARDDLLEQPNSSHFKRAWFDSEVPAIFAENRIGASFLPEEERAKDDGCWGKVAFFGSTLPIVGFDCDRNRFIGAWFRSESNPLTVQCGRLTDANCNSGHLCGALQHEVRVAPGSSLEFCVVIGVADRREGRYKIQAMEVIRAWSVERADRAFEELSAWHERFCDTVRVATPDESVNRHVNIWNKMQVKATFAISRDASRFHLGLTYGMGFRDTSQDLLGYIMFDAPAARAVIRELARQMFPNGYTYHNYFRVQNSGIFTNHSDDPLWFPLAVSYYLRETADFALLDEVEPYADPKTASNAASFVSSFSESMQELVTMNPGYACGGPGTILERCCRAIEKVWRDRSARGIPLMLGGDWNDDLNECGKEGKGESAMVAAQLGAALLAMIEILEFTRRDPRKVTEYRAIYARLKEAFNRECWDGEYYWRFTRDDGRVEGSCRNEQGKMYLEPQPWAVIGGLADAERGLQAMESVERYLETDYGPMICAPPYTASDATIGAATREAPGKKENASVFNHPVTWAIQANTILGRGDAAYRLYHATLPEVLSRDQDRFATEPYVYPEYTTGPAHPEYGKGGHSWLTGTAPWMLLCGVQFILGVKPLFDGISIEPCIPSGWDGYEVKRRFRGSIYRFIVRNPDHVQARVSRVIVDGVKIRGTKVRDYRDGSEHTIEVTM